MMGQHSTKPNKNRFQLSREAAGLTRAQASDATGALLSDDMIEKIENGKKYTRPDEVVVLSKAYKDPALCSYYCAEVCEIGKFNRAVEPERKELSQIVLEVFYSLNALEAERSRLVDIAIDGKITPDELDDFRKIRKQLEHMKDTVDSLQLWVNQRIANGEAGEELKN